MRAGRVTAGAGAVAVALAIGLGELLAGLAASVPSPVDAVGQTLIPRFPGALTNWAIATFGGANRAVLTGAIVVVALLLGAAAGAVARSLPSVPVLVFVAAGVLGILAARNQPGALLVTVLPAYAIAVGAGLAALRRALRAIDAPAQVPSAQVPSDQVPSVQDPGEQGPRDRTGPEEVARTRHDVVGPAAISRRVVLGTLGGVAAAAVAVGSLGRWVLGGGPVTQPTELSLPQPRTSLPDITSAQDASTQIDGLSPVLTPTDRFFRIDTALSVPRVDPDTWQLRVTGMVDRELELTLDDLLDEPLQEVDVTIACVSNEVGGDLIGTARWLGFPLADLLERAGVQDGATQVVGRSIDGWTAGFPTQIAFDRRDTIIAVGMNGEPLPARHGFPARLIVPGLFGYVSATKWLAEVELTTWEGYDAYWIPRGWAKEGPIKTSSRIDVPRNGERVAAGEVVVGGVAWAPTRGISDVHLAVDDGEFGATELIPPLGENTWVQWRTTVTLEAGEHELTVRAVDGDGQLQSEGPQPPAPDGAEGWHRRKVRVQA